MQKILAIDSAHNACSAAVCDGGKITARQVREMERGQAEALMPMIQDVMKTAGITFFDLDCIAVTVGPGSFTGVRVGLAAADGIALAAGLPMVGVPVMEAAAFVAFEKHPEIEEICVVLDTRRDDYYVQRFRGMTALSEPAALPGAAAAEFKDAVFIGNGVERLKEEIGDIRFLDMPMPDASDAARLAATKRPEKKFPAPMYLREAEVTVCRK